MRIIFLLAILTLLTLLSCQKRLEVNETVTERSDIEEQFFKLLPNADPMLQKIVYDLKKAYYNTFTMYADIRFIEDSTIVDANGFPAPAMSYPESLIQVL